MEEPQESKASQNNERKEEKTKTIFSRGIPSKDALFLPAHNSPDIRSFQDESEVPTKNLWNLSEVVNFVFPKRYQPTYHEVAREFLAFLCEKTRLSGSDISGFVASKGISKATFYNRVLPRLRRVGMIKVERKTIVAVESKRKYRPMEISLSKTFGNYLTKIGDSWLAVVDDARSAKK